MKYFLVVSFFSILFSCTPTKNNADNNLTLRNELGVEQDSIVSISLIKEVTILWNKKTSRIVSDLNWDNFFPIDQREKGIKTLINLISDTSKTIYTACGSHDKLVLGDFAFLLIDRIENIPYAKVYQAQMDSYNIECEYSEGMFKFMTKRRNEIRDKTKEYLFPTPTTITF